MTEKKHLTAQVKARLPEADIQNAARFCPKCGRLIPSDQKTCAFCGNKGIISRPIRSRGKRILTIVLIGFTFILLLILALYLTR